MRIWVPPDIGSAPSSVASVVLRTDSHPRRPPNAAAFPLYGVPIPTPLVGTPSHLCSTTAPSPSAPARPRRLKNSATSPSPSAPQRCVRLRGKPPHGGKFE